MSANNQRFHVYGVQKPLEPAAMMTFGATKETSNNTVSSALSKPTQAQGISAVDSRKGAQIAGTEPTHVQVSEIVGKNVADNRDLNAPVNSGVLTPENEIPKDDKRKESDVTQGKSEPSTDKQVANAKRNDETIEPKTEEEKSASGKVTLGEGTQRLGNLDEEEAEDRYRNRQKEIISALMNKELVSKNQQSDSGNGQGDVQDSSPVMVVYRPQNDKKRAGRSPKQGLIESNAQKVSLKSASRDGPRQLKATSKQKSPSNSRNNQKEQPVSNQTPVRGSLNKPKQLSPKASSEKRAIKAQIRNRETSPTDNDAVPTEFQESPVVGGEGEFNDQEARKEEVFEEDQQDDQEQLQRAQIEEEMRIIDQMRQKKQENLHEIEELDQQISQMRQSFDNSEGEDGRPSSSKKYSQAPTPSKKATPNSRAYSQHSSEPKRTKPDSNDAFSSPKRQQFTSSSQRNNPQEVSPETRDFFADSLLEDLSVSYEQFNQRSFNNRTDYLHQRAMLKKKTRMIIYEKAKTRKEQIDLQGCSFSPRINKYYPTENVSIVTKTKQWQEKQEKQREEHERMKIAREYEGCTFYPNGILNEERIRDVRPTAYYERSTEWRKKVNAANTEREKKIYSKIVAPSPNSVRSTNKGRTSRTQASGERQMTTGNNTTTLSRESTQRSPQTERQTLAEQSHVLRTLNASRSDNRIAERSFNSRERSFRDTGVMVSSPAFNKTQRSSSPQINLREKSPIRQEVLKAYTLLSDLDKRISQNKEVEEKMKNAETSYHEGLLSLNKSFQSHQDLGVRTLRSTDEHNLSSEALRLKTLQPENYYKPKPKAIYNRELPITSTDYTGVSLSDSSNKLLVDKNRYYVKDLTSSAQKMDGSCSFAQTSGLKTQDTTRDKSPFKSSLKERSGSPQTKKNKVAFTDRSARISQLDTRKVPHTSSGLLAKTRRSPKRSPHSGLERKYQELLEKYYEVSLQLKTLA